MKHFILVILILANTILFAQTTHVPDNNFEQALIDLGYDDELDDYVLTANISGVTELIVSSKSISDLTGSIAKGKKANIFITKDIPSIEFMAYAYGSDLIDTVILNGKIIR